MSQSPNSVSDQLVVGIDYTLRDDEGQVIDTNEGYPPLEFLQGFNQIIPGLEQALYGMTVGEEKAVVVAPAEGYGEYNPDAQESVPMDMFPDDMDVEAGMSIQVQDQNGQVLQATIAQVGADGVTLDFNHPLAGMTLHFDVRIASLRAASAEELDHGHVHGDGHEHQ
jgi:FKBP-type peptidyl-prolyl cis-trans isomerase SlyD